MPKTNYFLILGIDEGADDSALDAALERLSDSLKASNFMHNPSALEQASVLFARVREAHTALKDSKFREAHRLEVRNSGEPFTPDQLKPLIGHVCVAAGIISYLDLMDAIYKQTDIDLPLGQIMQQRGLMSQTELEGMLMGQKLYGAPPRPLEPEVKRLLCAGLITLDMIKIALIDQRTSRANLDELICKRGWIEKCILEALK